MPLPLHPFNYLPQLSRLSDIHKCGVRVDIVANKGETEWMTRPAYSFTSDSLKTYFADILKLPPSTKMLSDMGTAIECVRSLLWVSICTHPFV